MQAKNVTGEPVRGPELSRLLVEKGIGMTKTC